MKWCRSRNREDRHSTSARKSPRATTILNTTTNATNTNYNKSYTKNAKVRALPYRPTQAPNNTTMQSPLNPPQVRRLQYRPPSLRQHHRHHKKRPIQTTPQHKPNNRHPNTISEPTSPLTNQEQRRPSPTTNGRCLLRTKRTLHPRNNKAFHNTKRQGTLLRTTSL